MTPRRLLPWVLGACAFGLAWFVYNLSLPSLYKGRVCCDSVEYIAMAEKASGLREVFLDSGDRTFGYPLFLALHKGFAHLLGLGTDWVVLSLVSSLALHFGAVLFLYWVLVVRLKTSISPLFLVLTLAHPGLVSHAALPLTDSVTTSACTVALAFASWAHEDGIRTRKRVILQLSAGAMLGVCIVIRPAFLLVALTTIPTLWFLLPALHHARREGDDTPRARARKAATAIGRYTLPFVVGMVLVSAIAARNCFAKYGKFCISNPAYNEHNLSSNITYGLDKPRVYTTFTPPKTRTGYVSDPYSLAHFGSCTIGVGTSFRDLASCYAKSAPYMPLHLAKKTIGLFDNFHLNTYAADITRPWHMIVNRPFGWLGFVGWLCSIHYLYGLIRYKRPAEPHLVILAGFSLSYAAILVNFHIESRYGFPAVAPCFVMAGVTLRSASRRAKWLLLGCSVVFWIQVLVWDGMPDASLLV